MTILSLQFTDILSDADLTSVRASAQAIGDDYSANSQLSPPTAEAV